jgi:hypothetical protein
LTKRGDPGGQNGEIRRVEQRQAMAPGAPAYLGDQPDPSGLAATSTDLYFTSQQADGKVFRCSLGPGGCTGLTDLTATAGVTISYPRMVLVDSRHVYWTTYVEQGQVMRCPLAGCAAGPLQQLASGQQYPSGIAVTDECLFFFSHGDNDTCDNGCVWSMNKPS